jgi:hypothetical protein
VTSEVISLMKTVSDRADTALPIGGAASPAEVDPALPQFVDRLEVASKLATSPRRARALLRRLGLPVISFSERDWRVRRDQLLELLARLESEAGEAVKQQAIAADFLKPTQRGGPRRRAGRREGARR